MLTPPSPLPQPSPLTGTALRRTSLRWKRWLKHPMLHWLLLLSLALATFLTQPELDLQVSRAVYEPTGGFLWGHATWVEALYRVIPWIGRALLLAGLLAACWPRRRLPIGAALRWRRRAVAMLAVVVLGLWGLVNAGLKEHIGRPRPVAVQAFGGPHDFHDIGQSSSACTRNCSFVSGHAATGFGLMGFGLLGSPAVRRRWAGWGIAAGAVAGLGRILQGGHFLSDIVFAGLAMGLVCLLLRRLWVLWRWSRICQARKTAGLETAAVTASA